MITLSKLENSALVLYTVYIIGVTVGAIMVIGSEATIAAEPEMAAGRYIAGAFLRSLPFFLCANLTAGKGWRIAAAVFAMLVHGVIIGTGSVMLLNFSPADYVAVIVPRLLAVVPALIFFLCINIAAGKTSAKLSIFTILLRLILVTFLTSCVQFVFFRIITQFF